MTNNFKMNETERTLFSSLQKELNKEKEKFGECFVGGEQVSENLFMIHFHNEDCNFDFSSNLKDQKTLEEKVKMLKELVNFHMLLSSSLKNN